MDTLNFLVRTLTPRNFVIAAALLASVFMLARLWNYPRSLYDRWRYPPQADVSRAGRDILEEAEKAQARKVSESYRSVLAKIEEARANGFNVAGLKEKAGVALGLNNPVYRRQALRLLTEVEMAVPRKKARYIPADLSDEPEESAPEAKSSRAGKKRSRAP